jgi:DNA-directed RNA polymerase subunit RPC12/RpoP
MTDCKHWFIETWVMGPKSERWAHCPYCGAKRTIGPASGSEKKDRAPPAKE